MGSETVLAATLIFQAGPLGEVIALDAPYTERLTVLWAFLAHSRRTECTGAGVRYADLIFGMLTSWALNGWRCTCGVLDDGASNRFATGIDDLTFISTAVATVLTDMKITANKAIRREDNIASVVR